VFVVLVHPLQLASTQCIHISDNLFHGKMKTAL